MSKVPVGTLFPKEGEFCWAPSEETPERIVLGLPVGVVRLKVVRGPDPGYFQMWGWNGDLERPTLIPSIDSNYGDGEWQRWHGYLRDGTLVEQ